MQPSRQHCWITHQCNLIRVSEQNWSWECWDCAFQMRLFSKFCPSLFLSSTRRRPGNRTNLWSENFVEQKKKNKYLIFLRLGKLTLIFARGQSSGEGLLWKVERNLKPNYHDNSCFTPSLRESLLHLRVQNTLLRKIVSNICRYMEENEMRISDGIKRLTSCFEFIRMIRILYDYFEK